jgi:hypothetical protein
MPSVRMANSCGVIADSVIPPARMIDRSLVGHCVVEDCVVKDCIAAPFSFRENSARFLARATITKIDPTWREDNRRAPNGDQVNRLAGLAIKNKPSVDFCGYWQRHVAA